MRKLVFTLLCSGFITLSFAQTPMSPNVLAAPFQGLHFTAKADNAIEGSPLLFDRWKRGEVTMDNGETFPIDKINLDAQRNLFLYSVQDTIYEFLSVVKEIRIFDYSDGDNPNNVMVFRHNVDPESDNFVQVLDTGKITIFQTFAKKPEGENYSNGIVNNSRKYALHTTPYALIKKVAVPIKFSPSTLEDLTADKKKEVEAFVKENKLKVKKQPDFLKAIDFYNSIGG